MYTEKTPLTGGQPAYSFQNPQRLYKKQVKQFQCLLCSAVLALFAIALITAVVFAVDEDNLDPMNRNASLEGKLQSSKTPGAPKPPKPPKPIKLYTSGMVVKGTASGGFVGEGTAQIFDGTLPATIHLDSIIDPDAWSASADLTWSGVVINNNTLKGTFSVPAKIKNGTQTISKTFQGQFELELAFKWKSNLGIVIPNKVYNCKAVFIAPYKSSMTDDPSAVAQRTAKQGTVPTVETCNVMFQGTFYEKSFFCYITPWWCTDEQLFYWNGGLEFKIIKPPPPPTVAPVTVSPNVIMDKLKSSLDAGPVPGGIAPVIIGAKILGTVAGGWVTIDNDAGTSTVWDGTLPVQIPLDGLLFDADNSTESTSPGASNPKAIWTCTVSSSSLKGTFNISTVNSIGVTKYVTGSFLFLFDLGPTDSLIDLLESGVQYNSSIGFRNSSQIFNGTQVIPINGYNPIIDYSTLGYKAPVIFLGVLDKIGKTFSWDGRFEMIAKKDTKALKLNAGPLPGGLAPVVIGAKILGKVANGWVTVNNDAGASTVWDGKLPAQIPLNSLFFDADNSTANTVPDASDHKATWTCSVFSNSLRGTFKVSQVNSIGLTKYVTGSFFFLLDLSPTDSLTNVLESGVEFSSSIGFRNSIQIFNGTQIIPINAYDPSMDYSTLGYKAPVILLGMLDKVSKTFSWDGRFEMIAKKDTKKIPGYASQLPSSGGDDMAKPAGVPILGSSLKAGSPVVVGSKLIGKVSTGWITLQDDAGTKTIWNGEFPAAITAPMFFNPATNLSDLSDEFGHGAVWSCSVFHTSLRGSFSLPQYTKFGLVKWIKGSFFFQIESDPSWSLYDAVYPGVNYKSPIHFRISDKPYNGSKLIQFISYEDVAGMEELGFIAPVILQGTLDKATKAFTWDGRFEMIIKKDFASASRTAATNGNELELITKRPKPVLNRRKPTEEAQLDASIVGSKILGKVASGWITVTDDNGTKTIWNGELPAAVTVPMFYNPTNDMSDLTDEYGHGAVWSASVFHSTIKGTFQLPQYTKFGLVKWLKGRFYFQLEASPKWSLYDSIVPGINYYSPIHFRKAGKEFNDTKVINFYSYQTSPMDDLGFRAPIVLLGSGVNKGKRGAKSFTWDGRFVLVVKKFY